MAVDKTKLFEVEEGIAFDDGGTPSDTSIGRDALTGDMVFQDTNTGPHTLTALTSGGSGVDNFSYEEVDDLVTVTVPTFQLMFIADMLDIRGTLCVLGTVCFLD